MFLDDFESLRMAWISFFKVLWIFIPRPLINVIGVLISRYEREDLLKFRVNSRFNQH